MGGGEAQNANQSTCKQPANGDSNFILAVTFEKTFDGRVSVTQKNPLSCLSYSPQVDASNMVLTLSCPPCESWEDPSESRSAPGIHGSSLRPDRSSKSAV